MAKLIEAFIEKNPTDDDCIAGGSDGLTRVRLGTNP
jgi:hypothetical protein